MRFNFDDGRMFVYRMRKDQVALVAETKSFDLSLNLSYWDAKTLHEALTKALEAPGPKGETSYIKYGDDEDALR